MLKTYCCEDMAYHACFQCEIHDDPFDCPDQLILFDEKDQSYGLIIHDGGSSVIEIDYCPWCSKALKIC